MTQHTPEIGMIFETENGDSWTIKRFVDGIFYASHNLEFSCYEIQVTPEKIIRVTGRHHNIPYLLAQNAKYQEAAIAKANQVA